ncbi:MAG: RNA polymerase sigma factor SigZ [Bacteroidota bacterium]
MSPGETNVGEIYNRFSDQLRLFIQSKVNSHAVADDILQDVFLKVHGKIDGLRDGSRIESWIYQIARNAIIDHYRTVKSSDELNESHLNIPEEKEPDAVAERLRSSLLTMVNQLPPDFKEALILTDFRGLSQKEFADRLGISLSGAKSRIQRARKMLKDMLLECCHFELDHYGKVIDYYPRSCKSCSSSRC